MPNFVKEFLHCMEIVPIFPSSSTIKTNTNNWNWKTPRSGNAELLSNFKPVSQTYKVSTKGRLQSEKSYVKKKISNPNTRSKDEKSTRIMKKQRPTNQSISQPNRYSVLKIEEIDNGEIGEIDNGENEEKKETVKRKKRTEEKRQIEKLKVVKIKTSKQETSEGKFPEVIRCNKCFRSHYPFRKYCRQSILKRETKMFEKRVVRTMPELDETTIILLLHHVDKLERTLNEKVSDTETKRLRGGAGSKNHSLLLTNAIENGKKHGINLVPGVPNEADGNCVFDAVINNINHRSCFEEKFNLSSCTYRQIWVSELEMESANYPHLGAGYTEEEKRENWNHLKQSGIYEVDFFGDMVIHAIAKGCHKNILIFNTSLDASYPVYLIQAKEFGGFVDTDIPVILGYNQYHYESLHPISDEDVAQTKQLVTKMVANEYQFEKKDILYFITPKTQSGPDLMRKEHSPSNSFRKTEWTLEQLKSIKRRDWTDEQKKAYNRINNQNHRNRKSLENKIKERQENSERMKEDRAKKTAENKKREGQENSERMRESRAKKTPENKRKEREENSERMKESRAKKTAENKRREGEENLERMKESRAKKTPEDKRKEREENLERMKEIRAKKTAENKRREKKKIWKE